MCTRISQFAAAAAFVTGTLLLAGCGSGRAPEQAANAPSTPDQTAAASPAPEAATPAAPAAPTGTAPASTPAPRKTAPAKAAAPAAPQVATVEAGGELKIRTTSTLTTKTSKAGDAFEASLQEPLISGGRQVLPKGTAVVGKVVESDPGGRVRGRASISVELTGIRFGGQTIALATDTVVHEAAGSKKKDAAKVGIGAGLGAAIGAIAGGGKGAAIGAAAGGGAGTATVLATRGDAAEIPSESVLSFKLLKAVQVPAR